MMIPQQNFTRLSSLTVLIFLLVFSSFLILRLNWFSGTDVSGRQLRLLESHAKYQDLHHVLSMGGLLPLTHALDDRCHSRTQHHLYRRASRFKPSKYLLSKLRQYEKLHQRCAGEADNFHQFLNSSRPKHSSSTGCRFAVWISYSGLGNKLLTLTATFLYALLTDRVLLIDKGTDMGELLCEPFPSSSWLLPSSFPEDWLLSLGEHHPNRFGGTFDGTSCAPDVDKLNLSVVYLHLTHPSNVHEKRFIFCEREQRLLHDVPWLFLKSNNYFVPGFYFNPTFRAELERLFPDPETIFHHLGRYLLHPSNTVWDRGSRFYQSYLVEAEQMLGLQLRTFNDSKYALESYSDEVVECLLGIGLLPNVSYNYESIMQEGRRKTSSMTRTAVLVASLHQVCYERLRDLYVKFPTEDEGRVVKVHLPSHEEVQRTDTAEHDRKALMEMFLLSFSDRLVTSPRSTFGYVAQGLAGVKPMVLRGLEDSELQQPACYQALSMEPCFHAPPLYDCECQGGRDPGKLLSNVKHCRDVSWGIQLVNR